MTVVRLGEHLREDRLARPSWEEIAAAEARHAGTATARLGRLTETTLHDYALPNLELSATLWPRARGETLRPIGSAK